MTATAEAPEELVPVALMQASFKLAVSRFPDAARWPLASEGGKSVFPLGACGWPNAEDQAELSPRRGAILLARAINWGIPHCPRGRSGEFFGSVAGCGCAECARATAARREFRSIVQAAIEELENNPGLADPDTGPAAAPSGYRLRCMWCGDPIPAARGPMARFCKNSHRVAAAKRKRAEKDRVAAGG